jgi:hypothetical protein
METKLKTLIIAVALTILAGCAAPPPRIANTVSGRPEILLPANITNTSVHDAILESMVSAGYRVDADTTSNISVSKQMKPSEEAGKKYVYGGDSGTFRDEVSFTIVKTQNGVKVFAQPTWARGVKGQRIQSERDDNTDFNVWQNYLLQLRRYVENKPAL